MMLPLWGVMMSQSSQGSSHLLYNVRWTAFACGFEGILNQARFYFQTDLPLYHWRSPVWRAGRRKEVSGQIG